MHRASPDYNHRQEAPQLQSPKHHRANRRPRRGWEGLRIPPSSFWESPLEAESQQPQRPHFRVEAVSLAVRPQAL